MSELSEAELETLKKLVDEGPGATGLDPEHVQALTHHGYIEKREGGLLVTGKGRICARATADSAA